MAGGKKGGRVYSRDNWGRFASAGQGATARGGRLRTPVGNKRPTQTARLARMGGTLAKPKGLKPGALAARAKPTKPATPRGLATSRLRPGELMNAVARPVATMARPRRGRNPYNSGNAEINARKASDLAKQLGMSSRISSSKGSHMGAAIVGVNRVSFNKSHPGWKDPRATAIKARRSGEWASSSPMHTLYHEIGHTRDKGARRRMEGRSKESWALAPASRNYDQQIKRGSEMMRLARRVSRYAASSPAEFIAETYGGLRTGRRYDYQVMRAFREAMGLSPTPAARRRSRIRRAKP